MSSRGKSTAMVGVLGLGIGVNVYGTYYVLAQTGTLPPDFLPTSVLPVVWLPNASSTRTTRDRADTRRAPTGTHPIRLGDELSSQPCRTLPIATRVRAHL